MDQRVYASDPARESCLGRFAGLTQSQSATVIHKRLLAWQRYESGDRAMDAAYWELFLIKTGQTDAERERNFRNAGAGLDIASCPNQR